jgi:hypothetical protein
MGGFEIVYSAWYLPGRVFHISYKIRVFVLFVFCVYVCILMRGYWVLIFLRIHGISAVELLSIIKKEETRPVFLNSNM